MSLLNLKGDYFGGCDRSRKRPVENTVMSEWELESRMGVKAALREMAIVWAKARDQKRMVSKVLQVASLAVTKVN